jgi:LmbE family N-acetylglucosaminyl deacetylase
MSISSEETVQRLLSSSRLPPSPILLVVAHFDDEIIGVGGQLARWAPHTVLLHVTDSAPADGIDARAVGFGTAAAYSAARRQETATALNCLPTPFSAMLALDVPDRSVTEQLYDVILALRRLVIAVRPAVIVTHAYEGGHPDHDAIAFAVSLLRRMPDVPEAGIVDFAAYHEGPSNELVTNRFDDWPAHLLWLSPEMQRLKRLMFACIRTQARVLAAFDCRYESLRPAPRADFSKAPAGGAVWFERLGWNITSERWRLEVERVAKRLAQDGLLS